MQLRTISPWLLLGSLTWTSVAAADEPGCDFFLNALIGTKCKDTISAGGSTSVTKTTIGRADTYGNVRQDITGTSAAGQVSITPSRWLTLGFTSAYATTTNQVQFTDIFGATSTSTYRSSHVGAQTFVANANIYDSGVGAQRYAINAYVGDSVTPGYGTAPGVNTIYGGIVGTSLWRLGQSPFSINGRVAAQLAHASSFDETTLIPSAKLLLSHDVLGIAIGPTFSVVHLVSRGFVTAANDSSRVGGEMVVQPFRSLDSSLLNGLIVTGAINHSLGQANGISTAFGDASSMTYSLAAAFHFRY